MDTVDHRNGGPGARGTDRTPSSSDVRGISEVGWADERQVGGKAANLGELVRRGFPVPDGFVISAVAFTRAMDVAGASAMATVEMSCTQKTAWATRVISTATTISRTTTRR